MAEPRGFVVVGDTDWWDVGNRGPDILLDSRLLRTVGVSGIGNFDSIFNSRAIVPTAAPLYAELVNESGSSAVIFGVCGVSQAASVRTSFPGASSNSWGMRLLNTGNIYNNGSAVTTGLGGGAAGDRMALAIRDDAGTVKVQFYKVTASGVRTTFGSEVSFSADASGFYLCVGHNTSTNYATLMVDGPDLLALPDGAQPWGAAARVADRGGYSPGASLIGDGQIGTNLTTDAFRRTITPSISTASTAYIGETRARSSARFLYVEWVMETTNSVVKPTVGFIRNGATINAAYIGSNADGFSYDGSAGQKYNSGSGTAYGSTFTTGDVIGGIIEVATGKVWFSKNGTVQASGNPEAGTGEAFTASGDLRPGASPYGGGRVRFCTHAREQLYRPSYAEAWDGADLLPEQHFTDLLKRAPSVRREVSYYPWANQRNRGAAIGNLDLNNADGLFDALSEYDLRDQSIIAYRVRSGGSTVREFTGLVDGVTQPDARTCRVAVADVSAKLQKRVGSELFTVGAPLQIPVRPVVGGSNLFEVSSNLFCDFQVQTGGVDTTDWYRQDDADTGTARFLRTVNPAGDRQSVRGLVTFRAVEELSIANGDFSIWSGGNPVGWTINTSGTGGTVVQSGSRAVITANAGGFIEIEQAVSLSDYFAVEIKVDSVSATAGSAGVLMAGASLNIWPGPQAAGVYTVATEKTPTTISLRIFADDGGTITVDSFRVWNCEETVSTQGALGYLIEDLADDPPQWNWRNAPSPYRPGILGGSVDEGVGVYSQSNPTIAAVIDDVLSSQFCDHYTDESGVIQLAWMTPPEEVTSSDDEYIGEIAEQDVFGELTVADDYAPRLSDQAEYQRNYAQHTDDQVLTAASTSDRMYLVSEGLRNKLDLTVTGSGYAEAFHPFYAFALDAPPIPRVLNNPFTDSPAPASGVSSRDNRLIMLHRCYAARRRFYKLRISRSKADEMALRPGGVVELTHRRYGLSAGKNLLVTAIEPQLMAPTVALTLWG